MRSIDGGGEGEETGMKMFCSGDIGSDVILILLLCVEIFTLFNSVLFFIYVFV